MKINCEIDTTKTLTKGDLKIMLHVPRERVRAVMRDLHNFIDRPLVVDFRVDEEEARHRLTIITDEQRKKIHAILRDIAIHLNGSNDPDSVKPEMKLEFGKGDFSLADCAKELAEEFIEFLIKFCFKNGIPLQEHPAEALEDIEAYLAICLDHKVCAVCGREAQTHHWDAIGMGRDRRKVSDADNRKIALCAVHHEEAHKSGRESFGEKYHVYGILREG